MTPYARTLFPSLALLCLAACSEAELCLDDDSNLVTCEVLEDSLELSEPALSWDPEAVGGEDGPADFIPGPDDLDGLTDESRELTLTSLPAGDELEAELRELAAAAPGPTEGSTAIAWGRTHNAELRKEIPIGRSSGTTRFVVMRLTPSDLPRLRLGDLIRAAAELQVTTRCDIGQSAPGCNYNPNVRLQLLLTGNPSATQPTGGGTVALSDLKKFTCTKDEHHCVKIINFTQASRTLNASNAPPCVQGNSCYVNLVASAFHPDARSGGADKLLIGANEGNYLDNGRVERDRGRVMLVRERGLTAKDKVLRVTDRTVSGGTITLQSDGQSKRIYSHTLKGGADLKAGEKFRVWAQVDATSNHRVNLRIELFLTRNRLDKNGGKVSGIQPESISEHNGTNCSPGNPCHLSKVAVFQVEQDVRGPVYVNIAALTEVPGPGWAVTTIRNSGSIKSVRYLR